jgi:hypothetical protein
MAKFTDLDDDLDDVKPQTKRTEDKKQEQHKSTKSDDEDGDDSENGPSEDSDVEWGDEKLMAYDGLQRIKSEKGKVKRFAILPFCKPKKAMLHYVEGKGYFRCLSTEDHVGICCKKMDESDLRVVALAVEYTNASQKDGKYKKDAKGNVPPIEYQIGYVQLSRSNFRAISNLPDEEGTVYDMDVVMSTKQNGIGFDFTKVSSKSRWRSNPELAKEIEELCQKYTDGKQLSKFLGKKVTAVEMKAVVAGQAANNAEDAASSLTDIEDL